MIISLCEFLDKSGYENLIENLGPDESKKYRTCNLKFTLIFVHICHF